MDWKMEMAPLLSPADVISDILGSECTSRVDKGGF